MIRDPPVTVEPFQFSPAEPVAYEWSYHAYFLKGKGFIIFDSA
jgi:hypothetical protein